MTVPSFATAAAFQRIQMLEEALEKVLDRGSEMSVEGAKKGEPLHVWVADPARPDRRIAHSLHEIARELEALLP